MKILFIAPIPPPINGQSKASKVLLDALVRHHEVKVVNLSKTSLKNNDSSVGRVKEIISILNEVKKYRNNNDLIYISLAESFAGNMRDLMIYRLVRKDLDKVFIHMLGGAGMMEILSGNGWQKKANADVMSKIAGVLVEGPVNFENFKRVVSEDKIHIVPNFAEDFLFLKDEEIEDKFADTDPLQLLYLSNLIPGKGYDELAEAYLHLSCEEQEQLKISFVGGFEDSGSEEKFLKKISSNNNIKYLGKFIDGEAKRNLYARSHIFCLPTYYPFEGQPISILEAYATGCVVITSNHSGIPFIFKNEINGFMVEKKSVPSLIDALRKTIHQKNRLKEIAMSNKKIAETTYRTDIYQQKILDIFSNIG